MSFVSGASTLTSRITALPATLLALTLLAGCSLKPPALGKLKPHVPATYAAVAGARAKALPKSWIASFRSGELTRLGRMALNGNYDLDAAAARIAQADAQAKVARAAFYPQVNASGSAARSRSPGTNRSKSPPFNASYGNSFELGLTASYAIDFWGRNRAAARAGRLAAAATRFDYDIVAISTLSALANAYFQVLLAEDRLRIARSNIATADNVLKAIRAQVEVGTGTALDVAQQQSVIAVQRANVPALQQQLQQARNLVAVLVGRAPAALRVRGGSLRALRAPGIKPGLPWQLLLRRPDIAAAEARLKAANANITRARAALFPAVNLTGAASLESITLANLLRPEALALRAATSLAQPIFDGYTREGQLETEKARYNELLANYRKTIVEALSDVENALVAVRKTAQQERLRAAAVTAARRASQIVQQQLREGTIDVVTLLNTQQTLFNAQDALISARFQRFQAIVSLYQALGGGFTREIHDPLAEAEQDTKLKVGSRKTGKKRVNLAKGAGTVRPPRGTP